MIFFPYATGIYLAFSHVNNSGIGFVAASEMAVSSFLQQIQIQFFLPFAVWHPNYVPSTGIFPILSILYFPLCLNLF
jgi:hypothetical protein